MNEPNPIHPDDAERLARATLPPAEMLGDNDLEAATLRDGFLRMGELLDRAAASDFDEAAFIAKLQASAELPAVEVAAKSPAKVHRPWMLPASICGGVIAAAIIFLLCQSFLKFDFDPLSDPIVKVKENQKPPQEIPQNIPGNFELSSLAPWRDVLDDRLIVVRARVEEASYLPMRASPLGSLEERMRAVQHELNTSSL